MIPAILRQAAALDGVTDELWKHHREEKHFHWAAPPREAGRPSRMTLQHASAVNIKTVAAIPENTVSHINPAGPHALDFSHWRRKSKHRAWEYWPIYSAVFPWRSWQEQFARTSRVYRPLPKRPYARG